MNDTPFPFIILLFYLTFNFGGLYKRTREIDQNIIQIKQALNIYSIEAK